MMFVKPPRPDITASIEVVRDSAIPIAVQLRDQLVWLIATRVLTPAEPLPSIRTLATSLGIHHHTVRDVYLGLQEDGLVAIRHGARALVNDVSALQLARGRSVRGIPAIGVLIAGYDPFYLPFLRGIERTATELRSLAIVSSTEDDPVKARLQIARLVAAGVRGLIVASVGAASGVDIGEGADRSIIPVVYCDQPDQPDQPEESIVFDATAAGYELANHLASHGQREIVVITPSIELPNTTAI
jgi:DNA-binding transcriptional regulator YhcF (GntR family)